MGIGKVDISRMAGFGWGNCEPLLHVLDDYYCEPEEAVFALMQAVAHVIEEHIRDEDQNLFVDAVAQNIKTYLEIDRELQVRGELG